MTLPTAEMAELLSLLDNLGSVEDLLAAWPRIAGLVEKLDDIERRRKKPTFHRPRPRRDERDGSLVAAEAKRRPPLPAELYEFHAKVRSLVFHNPVFRDPRAEDIEIRLRNFGDKILDYLQGP